MKTINTFSSPLLYRERENLCFVHDTYRDFFLAKYFANKINLEGLPVAEVYYQYWSYEEDKELWHLDDFVNGETRAILPAWKQHLPTIASLLERPKAEELINVGLLSFNRFVELYWKSNALVQQSGYYLESLPLLGQISRNYNPFIYELPFMCYLAGEADLSEQTHLRLTTSLAFLVNIFRDSLTKLNYFFSSLTNTKSNSSLNLLERYLYVPQFDLLGAGPDGGVITYATIICPMLKFINTEQSREIVQKYFQSGEQHKTHVSIDHLDFYSPEDRLAYQKWIRGEYTWYDRGRVYDEEKWKEILQSSIKEGYGDYQLIRQIHQSHKPSGYRSPIKK